MSDRANNLAGFPASTVRSSVSAEEWKIRVELAALYRWVHRRGWDDHIYTHLSARVPAPVDHFLLNPLGSLFDEITASSLIKVDLQGNKLTETDQPVNWGGVTIHGALYERIPEAACVIHLHTTAAVAVSAQEHGLLPLSQFAMMLLGKIAYHDFTGLEATPEDRQALFDDLGDKQIMMLRNHGTLVWGKSMAQAFDLCLRLENACAVQVAALAGGGKLKMPSQAIVDHTAIQSAKYSAFLRAWDAVLRRLDTLEPDYKT
jgi:ribulose-5-phosphate 4-epimerase/fuculose-1-phosphate aldolase